jgi:tetratricopeptide (TPR) repeat protein
MDLGQGATLLLGMILGGGVAAVTVAGVMSLLVEQKVELWEAVLLAGLAVSMLAVGVSTMGSLWYLLALVGNISLAVLVCWVMLSPRSGSLKRLLEQDERAALAAIERDFTNAAAHAFLGDIYRKQGRFDQAIEQYRIAQSLVPSLPGERQRLDELIARAEEQAADTRRCPHCGKFMPRRSGFCPHCGGRMAWVSWIVPDRPREARRFWTTVALSLLGFVAAGYFRAWWAWVGLLIWISLVVIALTKPEEEIAGPASREEVDAVIEKEHKEERRNSLRPP